jgi:hypothetical protein
MEQRTFTEEDFMKLHAATHGDMSSLKLPSDKRDQNREEALALLISYAQDLVDMWPNITIRTLSTATKKIDDLKEALKLVKR